ncbi:hypothetical protein ES703_91446 [subsurface metagenome]
MDNLTLCHKLYPLLSKPHYYLVYLLRGDVGFGQIALKFLIGYSPAILNLCKDLIRNLSAA